jgi:hypothetical protein
MLGSLHNVGHDCRWGRQLLIVPGTQPESIDQNECKYRHD